jgi:hypothetical protein
LKITVLRNELASMLLGLSDRDVLRVVKFARDLVQRARENRPYGETIDELASAVDKLDGR